MEYTLVRWDSLFKYLLREGESQRYYVYYSVPGELTHRVVFVDTAAMSDDVARQAIEADLARRQAVETSR